MSKVEMNFDEFDLALIKDALGVLSEVNRKQFMTAEYYELSLEARNANEALLDRVEVLKLRVDENIKFEEFCKKQCFNGGDPAGCSCPDCGSCLVDFGGE